jgi:predicted RNA-binding protein associated with RNAse of E/G family
MPTTGGVFEPGSLIVAREVWDGLLWAARPAVVVSDDGQQLVHWSPAGSIGCFATSRFFPGREDLPRDERQLVSLETRQWYYRGVPARGTSLTFVRTGSWASVAATWHADGRFAHWYVNFQRPLERSPRGYDTLDLVLDIVVAPDGSWSWKDEAPYQAAMARGIIDATAAASLRAEAKRIELDIAARTGPFDPTWIDWVAPAHWAPPELPADFADGASTPAGATITLAPDPVTRSP